MCSNFSNFPLLFWVLIKGSGPTEIIPQFLVFKMSYQQYQQYLESQVVPGLQLTFRQVSKSYIPKDLQKYFEEAYNSLPERWAKVLHAAFKVINTSGGDSCTLIWDMRSRYQFNDNHEQTMANVVDYARIISAPSFPHDTDYYDVHVYFQGSEQRKIAQRVKRSFDDYGIRTYDLHDGPVGPHPLPMFEAHAVTPDQYHWAVDHLQGLGLSVLIHPNRGFNFRQQHFEQARWIGRKLELRTSW
jgi:aromatic ring-cleaving dioxygenase